MPMKTGQKTIGQHIETMIAGLRTMRAGLDGLWLISSTKPCGFGPEARDKLKSLAHTLDTQETILNNLAKDLEPNFDQEGLTEISPCLFSSDDETFLGQKLATDKDPLVKRSDAFLNFFKQEHRNTDQHNSRPKPPTNKTLGFGRHLVCPGSSSSHPVDSKPSFKAEYKSSEALEGMPESTTGPMESKGIKCEPGQLDKKYYVMEKKLIAWVKRMKSRGKMINKPDLMDKAEELDTAGELIISNNWYWQFLDRNNNLLS